MPYKRNLRTKIVWMASYYVPNDQLPPDVRKGKETTRIKESAEKAGYANSQKGAEQLESRREREIREGSYSYKQQGARTGGGWAREWTSQRVTRDKQLDLRRVEMHFLTFKDFASRKLTDFRPQHFREWARHGRELASAGTMSTKTFRNAYGVVRTMFHDAVVAEHIASNPCVVSRGDLPAKSNKKGRRYDEAESSNLAWEPKLEADVRMLFCGLTFTGERVGEFCGHIWSDLDRDARPLWALTVERQYDHQPLKTSTDKERPRTVPVHPELAAALQWWLSEGWEQFMGRKPTPNDPIIPNPFKRGHHTEKSVYHRSRDAFEAAGVFWKGHHACRHAFLTAVIRRKASQTYAERITHNASGTIVDHYTHTEWEPLCDVVSLLPWTRGPGVAGLSTGHMVAETTVKALDSRAGEGIRSLTPDGNAAGNSWNGHEEAPELAGEFPEESTGAEQLARHVAEQVIRTARRYALVAEPVGSTHGQAYNSGARHALFEVARALAATPDEERRLRAIVSELFAPEAGAALTAEASK